MIEFASSNELKAVSVLASWFFYHTRKIGEFDRDVWTDTWTKLIESGAGLILKRKDSSGIAEAIGAIMYPDSCDGKMAAYATFWYVLDEGKGMVSGILHLELENLLKQRGVVRLFMTSLINQREGKVSKYLLRSGYHPIEVVHGKELV